MWYKKYNINFMIYVFVVWIGNLHIEIDKKHAIIIMIFIL